MGLITVPFFGKLANYSRSWCVPSNLVDNTVMIVAIGAGAGGGSANVNGGRGGGGAGGAFARVDAYVATPGGSLTINIPGDTAGSTDGGDAEVLDGATVLARAKGGVKGGNAVTGTLSGSAGLGSTTGCVGDFVARGGNGSAGVASTSTGAGGGGSGTSGAGGDASGITPGTGTQEWGGVGGQGSTSATAAAGATGSNYGAGGSGGRASSATLRAGGGGTRGLVLLVINVADDPVTEVEDTHCDAFTGGDDTDIDGRVFDACSGTPSAATWVTDADYNVVGDKVFIKDGSAGPDLTSAFDVQYQTSGTVCPDEGPLNYQGARARLRWPPYDTVSVAPSCTLLWEDDFEGAATDDPLDGRVHSAGTLGSLTWVRDDSTSPPGAVSELLIDSSGRVYQPAEPVLGGVGTGADHYCFYRLTGGAVAALTDYDVVIDVERTSFVSVDTGRSNGSVGTPVRMQAPAGADPRTRSFQYLYETFSGDDIHGTWNARTGTNGSQGTVTTGSTLDPPGDHGIDVGETRSIRVKVRTVTVSGHAHATMTTYIYDDDTGDCLDTDARPGAFWYDGIFGTGLFGFSSGAPGLEFFTGGRGEENSYRVKNFRIYQFNPGTSGAVDIDGYVSVNLRCDGPNGNGYKVRFEGYKSGAAAFAIDTVIWAESSFAKLQLRQNWTIENNIPLAQGEDYECAAWIEDDPVFTPPHPILYAAVNGVVVRRFDLLCDIPDGSTVVLPADWIHTGGNVGITAYDSIERFTPTIRSVEMDRYTVLCPVGDEFPCEGGPDNPYPWFPPPITEPAALGVWIRKNNAWWPVPIEQQHPRARGKHRNVDPLIPPEVRYHGAWRTLTVEGDDVTLPPPDTELPPFFDPCELLPPLPPGDITPIPISDRFIGSQAWPVTLLGPVANGSKRAVTSAYGLVELAQAAARSSTLMGAQGGYGQYRLNNVWDPDQFISVTVSHLLPILPQLVSYTAAGTFFGYSGIDDFDSTRLWPPRGVSDSEMVYVIGQLHARLPGIRIGVRGRPSQFSFDPGVDFYEAQYKSWMGMSPEAFTDLEYNIARSRGGLICLNLNYLHGGDGSSGVRWQNGTALGESSHNWMCSPAEVVDYLTRMFDRANQIDGAKYLAGSVGYMYDPEWINYPGMLNAMIICRNVLAQLPPP